ncbi:hypothetical protein H9P43_000523 [Blastocladiella emersonii ATCC 22665]|nr:hypothetical protein H9P43_000523 [Blastocladiella emersonii ATCC 22665]
MARSSLLWFRRDLRLHDHPALLHAAGAGPNATAAANLFPVYCLEVPTKKRCGHRRWIFLLESLRDLDNSLRALGSRLFVVRGRAPEVLPLVVRAWSATEVLVQSSPEPFAKARDADVAAAVAPLGCEFRGFAGRNLFDVESVVDKSGHVPLTMTAFAKLAERVPVPAPEPAPTWLPGVGGGIEQLRAALDPATFAALAGPEGDFSVPRVDAAAQTVPELGFTAPVPAEEQSPHRGGETEALRRLDAYMSDPGRVARFEKPKTSPAAFPPNADTTVLSPYVTYGCLSPRTFLARIEDVYREVGPKKHTQAPVSLKAQLYWREFFMAHGATVPDFERVSPANRVCSDVGWRSGLPGEDGAEDLAAWAEARTGYPWIDAAMMQLRNEGWMHHLARHSVACFLTRGDLYVNWERGAEVFEDLLLDHDWALNRGNWLWLSGTSAFFRTYWRVYSPVKWGQGFDPDGKFIKRYLPVLARMPKQYIYEPWKAPLAVQKAAGCVVGVDYPKPMLDHAAASKANMAKIKAALAAIRDGGGEGAREDEAGGGDDAEEEARDRPKARAKRR